MKGKLRFLAFFILLSCANKDQANDNNQVNNQNSQIFEAEEGEVVDFRIFATSDLHTYMLSYDYYQDKEDNTKGLTKLGTIIEQEKEKNPNYLLVDNGDTIQGGPLGDYYNMQGIDIAVKHPIIKALEVLDYDVVGLGNHEFNFGLEYLDKIIDSTDLTVINSNVYSLKDGAKGDNLYKKYAIVNKTFKTQAGKEVTLKFGIFSEVPPKILSWDSMYLDGKIVVEDSVKNSIKIAKELREKEKVDYIIVLAHGGISQDENNKENTSYFIAKEADIDAIITGHSHKFFPSHTDKIDYPDDEGINNEKGTIFNKPAVMNGAYAVSLGVIDIKLKYEGGEWNIVDSKSDLIYVTEDIQDYTPIVEALADNHQEVLNHIREPIGNLNSDIYSYFALVRDDPSIQIINRAQIWYLEQKLTNNDLPILSAAAPFKTGYGDANNFTFIKQGEITIKSISDIYLYANNILYTLKLKGKDIIEWLEWSNQIFNTINPNNEEQELINPNFPSYNFDVIDGLNYEIDLTQKSRYEGFNLINPDSHRVTNITYNGEALDLDAEFIVATNNYRASTNEIVNPDGINTYFVAADSNRDAISNYIIENENIDSVIDNNWKFSAIENTNAVFKSSPNAKNYINDDTNIEYLNQNEDGYGVYKYTFN